MILRLFAFFCVWIVYNIFGRKILWLSTFSEVSDNKFDFNSTICKYFDGLKVKISQ